MPRRLANARADGDQHRERGGLQQPAQASWGRNEARDQQRTEHEHKKSSPSSHSRRKIKNQTAKQPSVKPDSQGSNKRKKAGGSNTGRANAAVQTQLEPRPGSETHEQQHSSCSWRDRDCRVVVLGTALAPLFDV